MERIKGEAGIPVAVSITLLQATAEWLAEHTPPTWSRSWWNTVEGWVRTQFLPHFGAERPVGTISRLEVEAFRRQQQERVVVRKKAKEGEPPPTGKKVTPSTVNRMMAAFASFGTWASHPERMYTLQNPWAKHEPIPGTTDKKPLKVTPEELAAFLAALPTLTRPARRRYPARAIFTFGVETGLRKSELARLRWEDIDERNRVLTVVSSWSRGLNKGKKERTQVLSYAALDVLAKLPRREDGLVFGPIGSMARTLRDAARRTGLHHVWFHCARHFGASRVAASGATNPEMKAWGGWQDDRMVANYSHTNQRAQLALVDRIADYAQTPDVSPKGKGGTPR